MTAREVGATRQQAGEHERNDDLHGDEIVDAPGFMARVHCTRR
jgi:hypothetical protein